MKKMLCIFTSALFVLSCFGDKTPTSPASDGAFAIYFLKDSAMTTHKAEECELSELEIESDPWLSIDDIDLYDFSTHCIYLKEDIRSLFGSDTITIFSNVHGKPFVVIADGERCYLGSFYTLLSSWMPAGPTIRDIDCWMYPKDVIHISLGGSSDLDVRGDARIRSALIEANIFHAGLTIQLDGIEVINRPDTSTVTYTFTITNNDDDDLYFPDPDLMGSELFHYYTHGVYLNSTSRHIYSEYKDVKGPEPSYSWEIEWFGRIESRRSLQRIVRLKGYPPIPADTYSCYFRYSGPKKIERDVRILSDGRLWLGEIVSNVIEKIVSN